MPHPAGGWGRLPPEGSHFWSLGFLCRSLCHNVAAGRDSTLGRSLLVLLIRIGNVNRLVKAALRVSAVEDVATLGSFVISLLLFGANRRASESHFVSAQNLP